MKPKTPDNFAAVGFGPLLGFAVLGGLASGFCHQPLGLWPLALVCLVPLVLAVWSLRPRKAAVVGLVWGIVQALTVFYWVPPLLMTHADLCPAAAMFLTLLGAIYQALFPAIFTFTASLYRPRSMLSLASLPLFWAGLEWLQGETILRLPWLPLGQALDGYNVLIQTAEWWGATGLSIIVVIVNVLLALGVKPSRTKGKSGLIAIGAAFGLVAVLAVWGDKRIADVHGQMSHAQQIPVMTVQADQSIANLNNKPRKSVQKLAELSRKSCPGHVVPPQLIIWPESAAPYYLFTLPGNGLAVKYLALEKRCNLILGAKGVVRRGEGLARTNRAWLMSPDAKTLGFYDKAALAPFGEYSPLGPLWLLKLLAVDDYEFARGKPGIILNSGDYNIGPLICFEALMPKLARMQAANGASIYANLSNEAWFVSGVSEQILAHMRLRCVENRRACVRSSNMGLSALILPDGNMNITEGTVLCGAVPLMNEQTIYSKFGGHWGPACLILPVFLLVLATIRRRAFLKPGGV